jgi:hypothetical protein
MVDDDMPNQSAAANTGLRFIGNRELFHIAVPARLSSRSAPRVLQPTRSLPMNNFG